MVLLDVLDHSGRIVLCSSSSLYMATSDVRFCPSRLY